MNISARLDIRTTHEAKTLIENAANSVGITVSAFVMEAAVEKAAMILERIEVIHLNEAESKRFWKLIENPPKPTEALKRLAADYKEARKKGYYPYGTNTKNRTARKKSSSRRI